MPLQERLRVCTRPVTLIIRGGSRYRCLMKSVDEAFHLSHLQNSTLVAAAAAAATTSVSRSRLGACFGQPRFPLSG